MFRSQNAIAELDPRRRLWADFMTNQYSDPKYAFIRSMEHQSGAPKYINTIIGFMASRFGWYINCIKTKKSLNILHFPYMHDDTENPNSYSSFTEKFVNYYTERNNFNDKLPDNKKNDGYTYDFVNFNPNFCSNDGYGNASSIFRILDGEEPPYRINKTIESNCCISGDRTVDIKLYKTVPEYIEICFLSAINLDLDKCFEKLDTEGNIIKTSYFYDDMENYI